MIHFSGVAACITLLAFLVLERKRLGNMAVILMVFASIILSGTLLLSWL